MAKQKADTSEFEESIKWLQTEIANKLLNRPKPIEQASGVWWVGGSHHALITLRIEFGDAAQLHQKNLTQIVQTNIEQMIAEHAQTVTKGRHSPRKGRATELNKASPSSVSVDKLSEGLAHIKKAHRQLRRGQAKSGGGKAR